MGEEDAETVAVDFHSSPSPSPPSKPRRRGVEGKRRGGRLFGDEDVDAVKDVVKDDDDDCHDDDANVDKDEEDADDADEKENHVVVECDDASEGGGDECDECDATAARETCTKDESPDDVPSRNVGEPAVETMDAMRRGGCASPAVSVESATSTETREGKRLSPRLPERLRFGTSLSQLYRLKHGEYVPVGAAGLAILDCKGAKQRDLLVYDPRKRPLVRRKIDERLSIEMQGDNFVTIHHGGAVLWSALMQNESDWLALGAQMLIAQHVAKCRGEIGFDGEPTTLDLASSANVTVELELGDSAQLDYEVVRGGVQGDGVEMNKTRDDDDVDDVDVDVDVGESSDVDHLSYQLYENSSRKVTGLKTRLEVDSTESVLPEQVIHGILGCGKDSRRLILVPKSETEFELYDVTVTRMKKGGRREKSSSAKVERGDGAVYEAAAVEAENSPREELAEAPPATTSPVRDSTMALHVEEENARRASTPHAYAGSPPPPWWMFQNQMSVSPMASSTDHHAMIVDVKRAVASLSEDLSFLTSRTRAGGAWIPPKPEGELKRALDELAAARDVVMLPSVAVETLSLGDVKQLTAEARRLSSLQDELRETRAKLQQTRDETHLYMERCSRAEEDLEAAQKDVTSLEEQLVREREKVELNKQRAQISAAAESARVAECVLRKEDSMFDADVREVTAPILQENKQLKSVLEDPKWIDEMDELREERDAAMAEVDRLQKYVSSLENNAPD